jgi:hypothetical protein
MQMQFLVFPFKNRGLKLSEVNMRIRKHFWIWMILLLFTSFAHQVFAQPYYFNHGAGTDITEDVISPMFWRFNLQTGAKDLFFSDSAWSCGFVSWNPTQQWVFITSDNSANLREGDEYYISTGVVNANSWNMMHVFPDQFPHPPGTSTDSFCDEEEPRGQVCDGIVYNPVKNVFYVTWLAPYPHGLQFWEAFPIYQKTAVYDASTFTVLDTLPVPPAWITSISSVSDDGNYLYVENIDLSHQETKAVGKYSLLTKQLLINKNLSDIYVPGGNDVEDSKKGNYLIDFLYPRTQMEDKKFGVYNIDKDSVYGLIPFPLAAKGYLSSDGKYAIIEETPWTLPNYQDTHPGRISVFNGVTGQLIQKLKLPPDGKVLVFDNYPNMLYYYLPKQNRSINIDLSQLGADTCTVKLLSSTGSLLSNGTLQYKDSTWENATNNNDGTFTFTTKRKKVSLRMTYAYGTQTKSNVPVKNDTTIIFQTKNVVVDLQNSQGNPLDTGIVQYNAGGWQNFGTTSSGVVTKELLPVKYTFRMTYNGATISKAQNIDSNATVVFQTIPTTVQLQTSTGVPLDTGIVQYNASGWKDFGITSNGVITKELLPTKYNFRMTYNSATISKAQSLDSNATVIFQTVLANVQLQTSTGAPLDTGIVQFNAGGWKTFGTTLNGVVTKELLPTKYTFRMTYNGATVSKAQSIDSNAMVVFQTVLANVQLQTSTGAPLDTGIVQYNSGGWKDFGITSNGVVTKELLPTKYNFRITYNSATISKAQSIDSNATIIFQTVKTLVQFNNSKGNPIDTGIVQFNSGGWKDFGNTSNGVVSKELLPVKYTFRLTYNGSSVSIAQSIDSNATVVFSTVLCTVSVTNTAGSLLNNATVSYNAGGWKVIGTTVNGIVTKELLPVKIQFRAAYGSKQQSVTQDVSINPLIAITLPVQ